MAERHFTPAEVEVLIPRLTAIMDRVRGAHTEATARQERLRAVRQRIEMTGGGVIDRAAWRDDAAALERATAAVREGLDEVIELERADPQVPDLHDIAIRLRSALGR